MQIIGVDCAAQYKNVGVAVAVDGDVQSVFVKEKAPIDRIVEWVNPSNPILVTIDAPLGWPAPMKSELIDHRPGDPIDTEPNALFRRRTDLFVHEALGITPLDVGADRIARTAHSALQIISELRSQLGHSLPLLWHIPSGNASGVIEVYPAATLKAHGLPSRRYKSRNGSRKTRAEIVGGLTERLSLSIDTEVLLSNDDALDAVVCILAGLDFLEESVYAPAESRNVVEQEGWIWFRASGTKN